MSNCSYAIRNSYACEVAAIAEYKIFNRSYTIRNSYTCKVAAIAECPLPDSRNAIRDNYTCKATASFVFTTSYYSMFCK